MRRKDKGLFYKFFGITSNDFLNKFRRKKKQNNWTLILLSRRDIADIDNVISDFTKLADMTTRCTMSDNLQTLMEGVKHVLIAYNHSVEHRDKVGFMFNPNYDEGVIMVVINSIKNGVANNILGDFIIHFPWEMEEEIAEISCRLYEFNTELQKHLRTKR